MAGQPRLDAEREDEARLDLASIMITDKMDMSHSERGVNL